MRRTPSLTSLRNRLTEGKVYRRQDLEKWSPTVDRHLASLVEDGTLEKLSGGVYYVPKRSIYGTLPPDETELIRNFLKDDRFLLTSPNEYNALGVGATQLYNQRIVYNHKRHGVFQLGEQSFTFKSTPAFPRQLSAEFLLVDLVNNAKALGENIPVLLENVKRKAPELNRKKLKRAVNLYGGVRAKKLFAPLLKS